MNFETHHSEKGKAIIVFDCKYLMIEFRHSRIKDFFVFLSLKTTLMSVCGEKNIENDAIFFFSLHFDLEKKKLDSNHTHFYQVNFNWN